MISDRIHCHMIDRCDDDKEPRFSTHPNFISFIPEIKSTDDLVNILGEVLVHQNTFFTVFHHTPGDNWTLEELIYFELKPENIEHLYHLACYEDYVQLVARMEYKHRQVFIAMTVTFDHKLQKEGIFVVSRDPSTIHGVIPINHCEIPHFHPRYKKRIHEEVTTVEDSQL